MGNYEDFYKFCGFTNGTTFRTKYFLDESTMTLTPCAELGLVFFETIPLLYFTILNFWFIERNNEHITSKLLSKIFVFRSFVGLGCSAVFVIHIILSVSGIKVLQLKSAFLIEYGLLALVWTIYSFLWMYSLKHESWIRSKGLIVSLFFASKMFHLILANRWILFGFKDPRTLLVMVPSILHLGNSIGAFVEWKIKRNEQFQRLGVSSDDTVHLTDAADEEASWPSKIFFCWTNQLIRKGGKRQLNSLDDVFNLPPSLKVATIERNLVENSPTFYSDGTHYSLAKSLLSTFGVSFFSLALLRLACDAFTFAGPILLHLLVDTFDSPTPSNESFLYAALMIFCSLLAALTSTNFSFYVQKISIKVRAATITAVFDKLTRVPLSGMKSVSSGRMTNFISTDVDCIVNFCNSFHAFWSLPVQLIIALYLLHREVGMAFLSGLMAAILLIPFNKLITNKIGTMSEKLMHCKDVRIKMIKETMEGMKTVKMCSWELYFEQKIGELRNAELKYLKARKYLDAVCVYLWASAPLLITISILATYTVILNEKLTAAKVFTALALVNILIMPLNAFPWVLNGLVEALVSLKRLEWFFALKNLDLRDIYSLNQDPDSMINVSNASFYFDRKENGVKNVSLDGRKGQIICVTGEVGCGKSTLLLGLLGESNYVVEKIGVQQTLIHQGIGFLGQERWLTRGSIRENILSGRPYDARLYEQIVRATCLYSDIKAMPGGDSYQISDNGTSLSGGQRTRVALARALYQDNSVYLLDEPFSSLDRAVADTVWKECIVWLKARGKLVIIATHDQKLAAHADEIILLNRGGEVMKKGRPSEVFNTVAQLKEDVATKAYDEFEQSTEYLVPQEEEKQVGTVRASVYKSYGIATGITLSVLIIAALMAMQASKNGADWWLSKWTETESENLTTDWRRVWFHGERPYTILNDAELDRSLHFLYIYACIAVANTIFTLIRAFLFAYGGVVAAKKLHASLLNKLMNAPLAWWDKTPAGRVINRLCSDVYTIDDNLPFQLNIFLASLFNVIGALIITLMGLPFLAPVFVILLVIYFFIQKYYRVTTVELKRLSTLALSPLYSLLTDTVNGLVTIRAQRFTERYANELRLRLTNNLRAQYSSLAASQWLSIRLSLIAVIVVAAITTAAIVQHRITHLDSGLVGLAISYALSVTGLLNGVLGSFIETEKEMVSVERIHEYIEDVDQESTNDGDLPTTELSGSIEFRAVCLRYQRSLPLALDNATFRIAAGQRVAVVGRTGSGKSSLFQALLRMTPIETGFITLDGLDIAKMDMTTLRKSFGIIPQAPFIFSGTLYDNLTLGASKMDHNSIVHIAKVTKLEPLLQRIGGIDGEIEEAGKNLSVGEKQLISVARILISKPKIILIDEATSHMDVNSHERVFQLLATYLPMATMICIVHTGVASSFFDTVIQMDRGRISAVKGQDPE